MPFEPLYTAHSIRYACMGNKQAMYCAETTALLSAVCLNVGPPDYQTDAANFKLDLSCLVEPQQQHREAMAAIQAISVQPGRWPMKELQEATTLDESQLQALQVRLNVPSCVCLCFHFVVSMALKCLYITSVTIKMVLGLVSKQ